MKVNRVRLRHTVKHDLGERVDPLSWAGIAIVESEAIQGMVGTLTRTFRLSWISSRRNPIESGWATRKGGEAPGGV